MNSSEIVAKLRKKANPKNVVGMARFGINAENTLGVTVTYLRSLGKEINKAVKEKKEIHKLSIELWETKIHEAKILATIIEIPELVDRQQAETWVLDLDSWDVCDGFCLNLIDKTWFAFQIAEIWAENEKEFVRRAGFATMAGLASHNKVAPDTKFEKFFPLIKKHSIDERNFVRKAVNWALRGIGKRNKNLLPKAIKLAEEIEKIDSKSARWIAKDALRELRRRQ